MDQPTAKMCISFDPQIPLLGNYFQKLRMNPGWGDG